MCVRAGCGFALLRDFLVFFLAFMGLTWLMGLVVCRVWSGGEAEAGGALNYNEKETLPHEV